MRLIDRLTNRAITWEGDALPSGSGMTVLATSYGTPDREPIVPGLASASEAAYSSNSIVFGAILARLMLFSEATFKFRNQRTKALFGSPDLATLENPWPNGTTGELLARMEQDVSLAGNAYIWNAGPQLVRLRPDWVTIVSELVSDGTGRRAYRRVIGYAFDPLVEAARYGGPQFFTVDEVAHWSPIPDPTAQWRGMSWLTPVIREIHADSMMTGYKARYLENAATPNLLIRYDRELKPGTVERLRERMQARYSGQDNAFKTLILDQGADATVVGNSFEQMNFTSVQAAGENRILIAAGVPGIVVGSKEGLMAATYSNYEQAMRRFADLTMRPLWRSACACLAKLVKVQPGARLWYDTSDIAALRQGEKERADTLQVKAAAVSALVAAGYEHDSIVAAVESGDLTQLTAAPTSLPAADSAVPASRSERTMSHPLALARSARGGGCEVCAPPVRRMLTRSATLAPPAAGTFVRSFAIQDARILERAQGGDGRTVEAYASVFDVPNQISDWDGDYMEVIDSGAFKRSLAALKPQGGRTAWNVGVFYNHSRTVHGMSSDLFSLPIGTPVDIRADSTGLLTVTRYNNTPVAEQVLEAIRTDALRAQSFSGRVIRSKPELKPGEWYAPDPETGELPTVRRMEIALREYGPTPFPAYEDAAITSVRAHSQTCPGCGRGLATPDRDPAARVTPAPDSAERATPEPDPAQPGTSADAEPAADDPPAPDGEHSDRHSVLARRIAALRVTRPGLRAGQEGKP